MEKRGVVTDDAKTKTAEETKRCPSCGMELEEPTKCVQCGTEPFEQRRPFDADSQQNQDNQDE